MPGQAYRLHEAGITDNPQQRRQAIHHRALGDGALHVSILCRGRNHQPARKRRSPQANAAAIDTIQLPRKIQCRQPICHFLPRAQRLSWLTVTVTEMTVVKGKDRITGIAERFFKRCQTTGMSQPKTMGHHDTR